MVKPVTFDMLDDKTPADVETRAEPKTPETDPTLGISVEIERQGTPRHRLVTIGDSLTQGFQSGAIFNTHLAYPLIIAAELGWQEFRYPSYEGPGDGLPLNLEWLARQIADQFGSNIDAWEFPTLLGSLQGILDQVEDHWERGEGSRTPNQEQINHNLAVYGWDLRNTISRTADICQQIIDNTEPDDAFFQQTVENANERAAVRVLNSARDANGKALSPVQAAAALGEEGSQETGTGDGIETLIIFIGANNALGSIITFNVNWTAQGYDDMIINDQYTVWRPIHFKAELDRLVEQVKEIKARHVIWCTVPHVTIAPFARGIGSKVRSGSRYYPYYTLPWLDDNKFNPQQHQHLTSQEARAIDSAIDQYNDFITAAVRQGRQEGRDWYLFEAAALLDRLASKRYIEDPASRPDWWLPYELPPALQALSPIPDSYFFLSNARGRVRGGLFSLDGVHPTTIGYGILAQELIKVMELAGVKFFDRNGQERPSLVQVDFQRLIAQDTLISQPPRLVANMLNMVEWLDDNFNLVSGMMRANF